MSDMELAAWLADDLGRVIALLDERDLANKRAEAAEERAERFRDGLIRMSAWSISARALIAADDKARGGS